MCFIQTAWKRAVYFQKTLLQAPEAEAAGKRIFYPNRRRYFSHFQETEKINYLQWGLYFKYEYFIIYYHLLMSIL